MDAKCVKSDAKESMSSASIDYKSDTFARRGVFSDGEAFMCLVCNKLICNMRAIPTHTVGKMHCLKLEKATTSFVKEGEHFICKLCTNYRAVDWKAFLCHFNDLKHFEELEKEKIEAKNENKQNSNFSYIIMMMNQIIEDEPGTFFCCCCKKQIIGQNLILEHISEEKHDRLQKNRDKYMYPGKLKESSCRQLVKNFIFHKKHSGLFCNLCNCSISGASNSFEHISGSEHFKNIIIKENQLRDTGHQLLPKNVETNKNPRIQSRNSPQNKITEPVAEFMRDNSITGPSRTGKYHCKLCGVMLSGEKTISSHVSGSQHKNLMQNRSEELTTGTGSDETSEGSSSSWVSTGNSSESWETYDGELQSWDSYENSSSWKSSDNVSDSWETISIQGSSSELQGSMLFDVPLNLIPLISKHYLQHMEKELFCTLCQAHLRSPKSIVEHTRSKYHVAELNRYKDQIAKENKHLLVTSKKNTTANSPANVTNKKPLQTATKNRMGTVTQKDLAHNAGGPQSKLLQIPPNLIPLISKHLLQHQEKEIFCVACQVRLQSPQSLVAHTQSRNHVIILNNYKAGISTKHKDVVDTSGRSSTSSSISNAIGKKKSSESINTKHQINTMPKAAKEPQPSESKLFKLPDYLMPMLVPHHLRRSENEIFCLACQVRLMHVNNMIEHISSKHHMARLETYNAEIAKKSGGTAKISNTNAGTNSLLNVFNEKPLPRNAQNPQSSLLDVPKKLLPLIAIHSLKHLKDEIYCQACQVHIKHASSLKSHTNSPKHAARLHLFRAETAARNKRIETQVYENKNLQPNVVKARRETEIVKLETPNSPNQLNTEPHLRRISSASGSATGLENSLNKLTIADVEGKNLQKLPQNQLKNLTRIPRHMKSQKPDTRLKKSRAFDPKFLKVNMQHIYEVNPEKLQSLKLSCQLCFPKTSNMIYCLACQKSVASNLQTFYEHICSSAHTIYLAQTEQNHQYFIDYPDQFSDLTLAEEFMQEGSEDSIQCFACDVSMQNDDDTIREHIGGAFHKERKRFWNEEMEKILREILVEMEGTWYNIQKYWCQPCDIEYNTEFKFAKHLESKKHVNCLKKIGAFKKRLVYDSCIACATLWLGFAGTYTQHCEQPMHKYLVQSGDFYVFKLPNQAITLLENAEAEVTKLIALSDQVLTVQKVKADSLLKCLEDTVKPVFSDAKAYPFGSRVSGLGFPDSDIDVFLDCGTYDGNNTTKNYQERLIKSVEQCLYANQQSWEIEEILVTTRTPIIKLRHRDTELSCDVSFKNGLSVENTKLLKCFIDNYPLCRKLMLFLKKWFSLCNLSGSQYITNYAACWYIIFFLQSKSVVPSVASLIAKENKSKIIDGWETGISESFDVSEEEYTLPEMLHGFFYFYTNFDFRYSVACPLLGRAVPKQDFTQRDLLPKEMAPYINHVVTKSDNGLVELFRIDSEMCVQDPYDLSHNLTKAVRKYTLNRFKRLCAKSAKVLNNFIPH